jgi:hypothetical protein
VTSGKIAPDAVTSAALIDGSVVSADIAAFPVTYDKLGANAITSGNVLNNSLTSADLKRCRCQPHF